MTAEIETVQTEIRDNAYETTPISWWGWPAEVLLAGFAEQDGRVEQDARAEKDDRMEQADRTIENDPEYATLYFVS
jgi:hypothetical protein